MPGFQPRHDTDPVWWGDQQVNNLAIASEQTGVRITAIHGWDDRPDVRDVRELRNGQDGEYTDNLYLGGRTITVEGEVYGSSWADLQDRKRALAALFVPSSDESVLKVPDPATASPGTVWSSSGMTGYERSSLRVIEGIQFGDSLDPMCQVWQVVLRASDPRVYSDTATSTDSGTSGTASRTVTVDQGGTYATPPTITVTGPTASAWSIAEPSGGLSLPLTGLALGATDTVSVDVAERTLNFTGSYETIRTNISSLVALWMLDESAGTTADNEEGTAAYDGTYTGGYTLNQSGPATGLASVALNGSTGYVAIPYNAALATASFSLEMFVKFDSIASEVSILDCTQAGAGGWRLRLDTGSVGKLTFYRFTGGITADYCYTPDNTIAANTWYHIVITAGTSGSQQGIYVNGVNNLEFRDPNAGSYTTATSQGIQIGRRPTGSNYFDGNIAAVAYYNEALTAAAVADLYDATGDTGTISAYQFLTAANTRWANLGTGSSTYTLSSTGLNTGSKLNVTYRDARL